jgi:hypothetical protein
MATSSVNSFPCAGLQSQFGQESKWISVNITPSVTLTRGTVLGEIVLSDVWSLSTGTQGSGTFTLSFGGLTTGANSRTITAGNLQTALRALSTIGATGVTVALASGTPGTDAVYTITFTGALANTANGDLTADFSSLGTPGNASLTHSATGQRLGTYKAYDNNNTDGSQTARGLLQYDVAVDSSGDITFGTSTGGGPFGQKFKSCPMFVEGTFNTADIAGLDTNAVADLGRLLKGSVTAGLLRMP